MKRFSWALLALVVGLGAGIPAVAGISTDVAATVSAAAAATPVLEDPAQATPSPAPTASIKPPEALPAFPPTPPMPLKEKLEKAKERVEEAREDLKERVKEMRDEARDRMPPLPSKQRLEDAVKESRVLEARLEAKVRTLRNKARLNESEKAELANASKMHADAAFSQRIALAQKMQAEGANASLVADFVAYAEASRARFANASNNSERKDVVVAFNQRWSEFKQAVTQQLLVAKLRQSVNASRTVLARLDAVIAKLSAGGFNATALVNASAAISARLDSVEDAADVPEAVGRLRQVHAGLVHLRQAIQRTINRELVDAYRELPMPSMKADASLRIGGSLRTSPAPVDAVLPSTPPTMGQGGVPGPAMPSPA